MALDDAEDNDSVFEFVFNRWAAALSLQDIDAYVCKQVLPVLKNTFDEVIWCGDQSFSKIDHKSWQGIFSKTFYSSFISGAGPCQICTQ